MEGGKWMNDSSIHHNLPEGPFHFIAVSFTCKRHHDRWVWRLRKCFNESGIASVSLTSSIMNIQSQCGMTLAAWKWRILLHLWDFTCLSSGCWMMLPSFRFMFSAYKLCQIYSHTTFRSELTWFFLLILRVKCIILVHSIWFSSGSFGYIYNSHSADTINYTWKCFKQIQNGDSFFNYSLKELNLTQESFCFWIRSCHKFLIH